MKTLNYLLLSVALSFTFFGCEKFTAETTGTAQQKSASVVVTPDECKGLIVKWIDSFDSPNTLKENWRLIGNPLPEWEANAYGREGLFNINGASPDKNYAVSDTLIGRGYGYIVESEVILNIINPEGTCVCPGIALARHSDPTFINNELPTGISMRIIYVGANATWFPIKLRNHTWLLMEFISENETTTSSGYIPADNFSNNWQVLKFEVTPEGDVKFSLNDRLLWTPPDRIHPMMDYENLLVLGYTSDGDPHSRSGVAYHNWVKATFAVSPKK